MTRAWVITAEARSSGLENMSSGTWRTGTGLGNRVAAVTLGVKSPAMPQARIRPASRARSRNSQVSS